MVFGESALNGRSELPFRELQGDRENTETEMTQR